VNWSGEIWKARHVGRQAGRQDAESSVAPRHGCSDVAGSLLACDFVRHLSGNLTVLYCTQLNTYLFDEEGRTNMYAASPGLGARWT
jgi:hypothetical protein